MLLLLSLLFSLAVLLVLVVDVLAAAIPVFADRGIGFLTSPLSSNPAKAGVGQGIIGTIVLAVIVAIVAFPFGLATAIYLEEYASDTRLTRFIQINIRNLAGVPVGRVRPAGPVRLRRLLQLHRRHGQRSQHRRRGSRRSPCSCSRS